MFSSIVVCKQRDYFNFYLIIVIWVIILSVYQINCKFCTFFSYNIEFSALQLNYLEVTVNNNVFVKESLTFCGCIKIIIYAFNIFYRTVRLFVPRMRCYLCGKPKWSSQDDWLGSTETFVYRVPQCGWGSTGAGWPSASSRVIFCMLVGWILVSFVSDSDEAAFVFASLADTSLAIVFLPSLGIPELFTRCVGICGLCACALRIFSPFRHNVISWKIINIVAEENGRVNY